jgi:site-specific DNA-methyltransferase (adenine-specific)
MNNNSKIGRVRNDGRWHSRGSDWSTPQDLFDELDKEFGFTLDPCASDWNHKYKNYFTETENGLLQDWGKNAVFCNPPYGKALNDWMRKAYESAQKGATVVCLVPAATDTAWWHNFALKGEIRCLRGRPRFVTKEGSWQQTFSPSVIVVFRKERDSQTCSPKPRGMRSWSTTSMRETKKHPIIGADLLRQND